MSIAVKAARLDTSELLRRFDEAIREAEAASPRPLASRTPLHSNFHTRSPRPLPTEELLKRFDEAINSSTTTYTHARTPPMNGTAAAALNARQSSASQRPDMLDDWHANNHEGAAGRDLEADAGPHLHHSSENSPTPIHVQAPDTTKSSSTSTYHPHTHNMSPEKGQLLPSGFAEKDTSPPHVLGVEGVPGLQIESLEETKSKVANDQSPKKMEVASLQIEDGQIASNSITHTLVAGTRTKPGDHSGSTGSHSTATSSRGTSGDNDHESGKQEDVVQQMKERRQEEGADAGGLAVKGPEEVQEGTRAGGSGAMSRVAAVEQVEIQEEKAKTESPVERAPRGNLSPNNLRNSKNSSHDSNLKIIVEDQVTDNFDQPSPSSKRPAGPARSPTGIQLMKLGSVVQKQMRGRSRLGAVVTELSGSWTFVSSITQGIRAAVERQRSKSPDAELTEEDFHHFTKDKFVQPSSDNQVVLFKFKDYAPAVFRSLRYMFGVDDQSYLNSCGISHGLSELSTVETGSKSGQMFLISHDGRYFMKTTTKSEARFFRRCLPQYYEHMTQQRDSLLCRFFGLHRIKPGKLYLLVMGNIFDTDRIIHKRFDLKGSTVGRAVSEKEKQKPTVILKDLDFLSSNKRLQIGMERKKELLNQIELDCIFLRSIRVMDYSLLLGVHYRDQQHLPNMSKIGGAFGSSWRNGMRAQPQYDKGKPESLVLLKTGSLSTTVPEKTHTSAFQQHDGGLSSIQNYNGEWVTGNEIYFLGIIDFLQYYNTRKHAETAWKSLKHKRNEISAVPPKAYSERFQSFMASIMD